MRINYDDYEYEVGEDEVIDFIAEDMADSYFDLKDMDKKTREKVVNGIKVIITELDNTRALNLDELFDDYEDDVREHFESSAKEEKADSEARKDIMSYNGIRYSDFI